MKTEPPSAATGARSVPAVDMAGSGSRSLHSGGVMESGDVQRRVLERTSLGRSVRQRDRAPRRGPHAAVRRLRRRRNGRVPRQAGFETFSHRKSVLTRPTRRDSKLAYPPYAKVKERLIRRFL